MNNIELFSDITKTLSDRKTIEKFIDKYGFDFINRINHDRNGGCYEDGCPKRLHFEMGISHGEAAQSPEKVLKIISYNNDIIGLFYNHPNYCKGFSDYPGGYPVTCSCWKGKMYIQCLGKVFDDLYGWGTREIIAKILGCNDNSDFESIYRAEEEERILFL